MERIRVVLADNNYIVRQGLKTILLGEEGFEVMQEVTSGAEMLANCNTDEVDVVLVDYASGTFRIDDVKAMRELRPNMAFVAITEVAERNFVREAMRVGIKAHILKDCSHNEIIDSVRHSISGESFFCGKVLNVLNADEEEARMMNCEPVSLSVREIEIIRKIAEGLTNKQVAEDLHLSAHTVMTHRKNIMNKLGINNTAGLVIYAIRENLISPNKFLFNG